MAWKPGQSGNPRGKRPGQTPRGKFRALVNDAIPDIVARLVAAAQAGDVQAARLILDRTIPALRPSDDLVRLPLPEGAPLADQGAAILAAAMAGTLTPGQAADMHKVVAAQSQLVEMADIMGRLEGIEKCLQKSAKQ